MESVDLLKKRLTARVETTNIIDVMKKAAVSQLRNLETISRDYKKIVDNINKILDMIDISKCSHPFIQPASDKAAIVIITSDEGFTGGLNTRVMRMAMDIKAKNNTEVIVVGERGSWHMEDTKETFTYFQGISEEVRESEVSKIKEYLIHKYLEGEFGDIAVVYPRFISFSHQEVDVCQLLPCRHIFRSNTEEIRAPGGLERRSGKDRRKGNDRRVDTAKNASPEQKEIYQLIRKGGERRKLPDRRIRKEYDTKKYKELLVEPSTYSVVSYIVNLWLDIKLYNIFKESKMSEFAARAMHLEGSYQEFSRSNKHLRFQYLRSVHESVDKAIREVFASKLLWSKK